MSWGGIKRTPADVAFSKVVREANDNICERCGKPADDNSHFYGRRNNATRLHGPNCTALCRGCHLYLGEHPHEHTEFMRKKLGDGGYDLLVEKSREICKLGKAEVKKAAAHYRRELEIIKRKRMDGQTGYIEFVSWQ